MRRNGYTLLIAFVPLLLVVAAHAARVTAVPGPQAPQATSISTPPTPTSVKGTVTYRGLVTLAADARLTVQLVEISRVAEAEVVLAEQAIVPVGGPGPFQFEIGYDPASIKPNGVYLVGASIVSGGNVVYWTTTRPGVITQGRPMTVDVVLAEAAPSSYANMALSSGRLAPSTY